ncbi:MAG TPA: thioesterase family protein [Ilumatobacteraceae bacterium]|nr:thioesterase family protein [Ilumatobacteraceae bacterium]
MRTSVEPSLNAADYPFSQRIRVRFAETDAMGIVHHSRYLPYFEEARVAYLRHVGHPYDEVRAQGVEMAVLEAFVQYRKPLEFDDVFDVHVTIASLGRVTFQMAYLLTVGAVVHATGVTVHGCITPDGRATRMPPWLAELAIS